MTRRVQTRLQIQGGPFRASFVNVIKTENSLYLINEDRQDIYLYDFFSLFLGVQSAREVGPTSYKTLCIEDNSCRFQTRMDVPNVYRRAGSFAALANETVPRCRRGASKQKNSHAERVDRRRQIRFDNKLYWPRCT